MRHRLLLLPALLAATACIREPDPTDLGGRQLSVHAVLEAGADSAVVLITRPARVPYDAPTRISGAEVRLIHEQDTVWLAEDPAVPCAEEGSGPLADPGDGCYRAMLPEPIRAGESYTLRISLPDGGIVNGLTEVPAPPSISRPEEGARFVAHCDDPTSCFGGSRASSPGEDPVLRIPIEWTLGPVAADLDGVVHPSVVYAAEGEHPGSTCFFAQQGSAEETAEGELEWPIEHIFCSFEEGAVFDSIRAELRLVALDPHYAAYRSALEESLIRSRNATQGLEGSYGVFGAVAEAARSVMIIRDPPPDTTATP